MGLPTKTSNFSPLAKIDSSRESTFCTLGTKFSYMKNALIIDISITDVCPDLVDHGELAVCWYSAGLLELTDEVSGTSRYSKVAPRGVNPVTQQISIAINAHDLGLSYFLIQT
jgi:hypothetical protein